MIKSDTTQESRILQALREAKGEWINGQYFLRTLLLSQYHRAIWNLQNKRDRYGYEGRIEASDFKDEHGFKSYRLTTEQIPKARPCVDLRNFPPAYDQKEPEPAETNQKLF